MNLGSRLKQYREALSISSSQLSFLSGVAQSTISDIENGNQSPRIETLERICQALQIDIAVLLKDPDLNTAPRDILQIMYYSKQLKPGEREAVLELIKEFLKRDKS